MVLLVTKPRLIIDSSVVKPISEPSSIVPTLIAPSAIIKVVSLIILRTSSAKKKHDAKNLICIQVSFYTC